MQAPTQARKNTIAHPINLKASYQSSSRTWYGAVLRSSLILYSIWILQFCFLFSAAHATGFVLSLQSFSYKRTTIKFPWRIAPISSGVTAGHMAPPNLSTHLSFHPQIHKPSAHRRIDLQVWKKNVVG